MSFITLQSKRNETSPQALDSSYFRNEFTNEWFLLNQEIQISLS